MESLSVPLYDITGKITGTIELAAGVFHVAPNPTLLHQVVVTYLANRRATTAHTKDRSEVRGGGRKPWRQKGTGNARAGSTRSPLWRGGGVTFGPRAERNYSLRMPQKMRQAALRMALSVKVADDALIALASTDSLDGKTKSWLATSTALPLADKKTLLVIGDKHDLTERAIRNVENHKCVPLAGLTAYDILRYPRIIMTKEAIESLTERLSPTTTQVDAPVTKKPKTSKVAKGVTV